MKGFLALLPGALVFLAACSANTVQRSGEGAIAGAAAGAVGGMFSALVFGGDMGDAAARGAVWGAGTGAVGGAMRGAAEDSARRRQMAAEQQARQDAELARLRAEIGEDAFAGLEALALGKHEVALAYARTARRESSRNYALAGSWLEALAYADSNRPEEVERLLPGLVAADPGVGSLAEAERTLAELRQGLADIRADFGLPAG